VAGALLKCLHDLSSMTKALIELLAGYHVATFSSPELVDHWKLLLSVHGTVHDAEPIVETCLDFINA
jgi:hypothetical protein